MALNEKQAELFRLAMDQIRDEPNSFHICAGCALPFFGYASAHLQVENRLLKICIDCYRMAGPEPDDLKKFVEIGIGRAGRQLSAKTSFIET